MCCHFRNAPGFPSYSMNTAMHLHTCDVLSLIAILTITIYLCVHFFTGRRVCIVVLPLCFLKALSHSCMLVCIVPVYTLFHARRKTHQSCKTNLES